MKILDLREKDITKLEDLDVGDGFICAHNGEGEMLFIKGQQMHDNGQRYCFNLDHYKKVYLPVDPVKLKLTIEDKDE